MQGFVESLEGRALLSGTTGAMLSADKSLIGSDAAAVKADLAQLVAGAKTDDAPILAALKGVSPSTNGPLLKSLKSAESALKSALTKDVSALLTHAESLASKSVVAGESLVKKSSSSGQAKVTAAIAALNAVCTTPLAAVQSQLASTTVINALNALNTANPSVSNLSADITTRENDAASRNTAIGNAAVKLQTDVLALATDLGNIPLSSSTIPNVVGNFNGTALVTKGKNVGQTDDITIVITSEDAAGNLIGTLTNVTENHVSSLKAAVTMNGKFTGNATPTKTGSNTVVLLGQFSSGTLTGTFKAGVDSGTFTVMETT